MAHMTIDECRDEIAKAHNWRVLTGEGDDRRWVGDGFVVGHPIPATTDAALEIIEKAGYRFLESSTRGGITVQAREWNRMTNFSPVEVTIPTMPWSNPHDTFKQALWNLAAAVTRQEGKA
jgi:hypothetical protein